MDVMQIAAVAIAGLGSLVWLANLLLLHQCVGRIPLLANLKPAPPERWPKVSVVIPACNEAHTLGAALASHLASDYPDIEYVVVDDRSTDATAGIVDRIAAADARVRAVHITELPEGWLGKVHALHVGQAEATGEWLLFADADARVEPDTLRRLIAWCEAEEVDLVSPVVRLLAANTLLDLAVSVFARTVVMSSQPWRSEDPKAKQAFGAGAYILVRRATFERTRGFAWLRMEVADDMALALLLKRAGARLRVVNARDHIHLTLYTTLGEVRRSTEKGGYSILGRYSLLRTVVLSLALPFLELAPFAAFLPVGVPWLPALGVAALGLMFVVLIPTMLWLGRPGWTGVFYPIGVLWLTWLNLRSGFIGARAGGIRWRNTFYPSALLRSGMRVMWP